MIDADHDGMITRDELRAFCGQRSSLISGNVDDAFTSADQNQDGLLNIIEFQQLLGNLRAPMRQEYAREMSWTDEQAEQRAKDMFAAIDLDMDGKVTREDISKFFHQRDNRFLEAFDAPL